MEQHRLFRKAALDKLASPERLDTLMQVTSPLGWVALWTIGGVLIAVLIWSIFATIPERVDGYGMLIGGGSLREIRAPGDGSLVQLETRVGETVEPGQVVGEVAGQGTDELISEAQVRHDEAVAERDAALVDDTQQISQARANIANYEADIKRVRGQLAALEEDLKSKRALLTKGLVTKSRVQQLEQQALSLNGSLTALRTQINGQRSVLVSIEQRRRSRDTSVVLAEEGLEQTLSTAASRTRLISRVAGRVIEVNKRVGDRVRNGEVVAIIEPSSSSFEPIVYVSANSGKRINLGMEAEVSPTNVKREEYGFLRASVSHVGAYPVSPEMILATTANQTLAQQLSAEGATFEVRADLVENRKTPSGFTWSSSEGPPFRIVGGTPVTVSVIVDRRAPITYVLPLIRSTLGAS
ncbi:MAG: NHLP bacteriocin system secretion protein [Luteitalea sp.]|nr:NHLP bacteriocin system secretion protein [Luteitalea sp.]